MPIAALAFAMDHTRDRLKVGIGCCEEQAGSTTSNNQWLLCGLVHNLGKLRRDGDLDPTDRPDNRYLEG